MIVGITGIEHKLGKAIAEQFPKVKSIDESLAGITECDIFVNNLAKGNLQKILYTSVFNQWVDLNKTIVNIVSTIVFDEVNTLGSYGETKIELYKTVKESIFNNPNKSVRVINIYPSTLSSNKNFDNFNKVDIVEIAKLVKTVTELPQEIEVRDLTIYPTSRDKKFYKNSII